MQNRTATLLMTPAFQAGFPPMRYPSYRVTCTYTASAVKLKVLGCVNL